MGNLMTSMWTAVSGLNTSQAGLTATSHNLANVDTKGYTRQQLIITDSCYNTVSANCHDYKVGLGSVVEYTRQLRNIYHDASYRRESSREGFYQAQYETLSEVEELFGEMEGVSFQDTLSNIWNSMEELSKEPESLTARTTLVNNLSDFINRAQDIYEQIEKYQKDINTSVNESVNRINELANKIFEYNKKISDAESAGVEHANDYRDERNLYLDELSNLIDIDTKERADGTVLVLAEGSILVSDFSVNKIELRELDPTTQVLTPVWKNTGEEVFNASKFDDLSDYEDSGYLKGLIMARGTYAANYTDIPNAPKEPVYPMRTDFITSDSSGNNIFDQTGYDAAVAQYAVDYQDYKLDVNRYANEVSIYNEKVGTSSLMSVMSGFDKLVNGIVTSINDILCPNKEIEVINADGTTKTIKVLDEDKAPIGMDANKTMGEELIKRTSTERYVTTDVTTYQTDSDGNILYDAAGNALTQTITVRQYQEEVADKKSTQYTLGELEVNKKILDNYSILALSENGNSESFSYSGVVVDLIKIWDEPFSTLEPNTLTTYTFGEFYNAFIGDIGNTGKTMKDMMESQETLMKSVDDKRNSYSGVSSDEELGNLLKYQHAYNAASRYFNVINSMMDSVMSMLG